MRTHAWWFADDDCALCTQRRYDLGIGGRDMAKPRGRAVAGVNALGVDQVLHSNGQAFEPPWPAFGIAPLGLAGRTQRTLAVDSGESM